MPLKIKAFSGSQIGFVRVETLFLPTLLEDSLLRVSKIPVRIVSKFLNRTSFGLGILLFDEFIGAWIKQINKNLLVLDIEFKLCYTLIIYKIRKPNNGYEVTALDMILEEVFVCLHGRAESHG